MAKKGQLKLLMEKAVFETSQGELTIKPFRFMDFSDVLEIVERYYQRFEATENVADIIFELSSTGDRQIIRDIFMLLEFSGVDREIAKELGFDEIISLLTEVVQMNMDFFTKTVQSLSPVNQDLELKDGGKKLPDLSDMVTLGEK